MSIASLHTLAAVTVGTAQLGGITRTQLGVNTGYSSGSASGNVFPTIVATKSKKISGSIGSFDLAAALAAIPLKGKDLAANTLTLYAQATQAGGTRATGSVHRSYAAGKGVIVLGDISVANQGDATVTCTPTIVSADGVADPLTIAEAAALPTGIVDDVRFSIGKVVIGGVTLTQITDVRVNFGVSVVAEGGDSEVWDSWAYVNTIAPTITITGNLVTWLKTANIPLGGKAAINTNTTIYFRKRLNGGLFESGTTAVHVKLTAAGIADVETVMDASGGGNHTTSVQLTTRAEGSNDPIVINTASAIT